MLSLDWNLVITIINLIVLYLLMSHFLIKPVLGIMEKRRTMIEQQISDAARQESRAMELKSQYEEKLKLVQEETAAMVAKARENAKLEYSRILSEADRKADQIMGKAQETIKVEREKTLLDAESKIGGLVAAAVQKVVAQTAGSEQDRIIYQQFLAKAGESIDADRS